MYTVIATYNYGPSDARAKPRKWFPTRREAEKHAEWMLAHTSIGRSSRANTETNTSNLRLFVVQVKSVVEVQSTPMVTRKLQSCDVDAVFFNSRR